MKRFKSNLIALLVILVIAGAVYTFGIGNPVATAIQYNLAPIARGS